MEKCQVCGNGISEEPKQGLRSCTVCACPAKPLGSMDPMTRKEYDQAMLMWSKNLYGQSAQRSFDADTESESLVELSVTNEIIIEELVSNLAKLTKKFNELERISEERRQEQQENSDKLISKIFVMEESLRRFDISHQDVRVVKDGIDHNKQLARRVDAIEVWCQSACEDISALQQQPISYRQTTTNRDSETSSKSQPVVTLIESSSDSWATKFLGICPTEQELVILYNQFNDVPEELLSTAQEVSLSEKTLNRLRNGDTSRILFKYLGDFLLVNRNGWYYLLPKRKRFISEIVYRKVKLIYSCSGYHEDYDQLVLIKPACLEKTADNQWQLSQTGTLKFIDTED